MNQMGLAGEKWAATVDKQAVASSFLRGEVAKIGDQYLQLGRSSQQVEERVDALRTKYSEFGKAADSIHDKFGTQIKTWADYQAALQGVANRANEAGRGIQTYSDFVTWAEKNTKASASAIEYMGQKFAEGNVPLKTAQENLRAHGELTTRAANSAKLLADNQEYLNVKYQSLIGSQTKFGESATKIISQMEGTQQSFRMAQVNLTNLDKAWGESIRNMAAWEKAVEKVEGAGGRTGRVVMLLDQAIQSGNVTHKEAVKLLQNHVTELGRFSSGVNRPLSTLSLFTQGLIGGGAAANVAAGYIQNLTRALTSLAAWIVAAMIIGEFIESISKAINAVTEFDQSLKALQAISQGTEAEISLLGDEILDISDKTKYSATEIGKGAIYIAQAGFSAGESLQVIAAAARGAQGTLEPLNTAADLLTTVLRAFKIPAEDASRVMDMLTMAANKSKTDLEGLRTVFNYIGPAAHAAGASLGETLGAIMALSNEGMRMSTIGTSLRQVFIGLENPSAKLRNALQDLGMTTEDLSIKKLGLAKVAENLGKVVGGSLTNAVQFFNVRAGNAALVISTMHEHLGMMIKFTEQYGAAAIMAGTQTEGLSVKISVLGNRFTNMIIRMSQGGLTDVFGSVITGLTKIVDVMTYLTDNAMAKFLAMVFLLKTALGILTIAIKAVLDIALVGWLGKATVEAMGLTTTVGLLTAAWNLFRASLSSLAIFLTGSAAAIGYIGTASVGAASSVGILSRAWLALKAVIASNPFGLLLTTVIALGSAIYAFSTSSAELGKTLQKNTITYTENSKSAVEYAKTLLDLNDRQSKGEIITDDYLAVLRQVKDTFPELSSQMLRFNGNLEAQAGLLTEVSAKYEKMATRSAVDAIQNLVKEYDNAAKSLKLYSDYLNEDRGLLVQWGTTVSSVMDLLKPYKLLLSLAGMETSAYTEAVTNLKITFSALTKEGRDNYAAQQMFNNQYRVSAGIYQETASVIINSSKELRQKLLDSLPQGEYANNVKNIVELNDKMVASLKAGMSDYQQKQFDSLFALGAKWQEYYAAQDIKGQGFVLQQAALAEKAAKKAVDTLRKETGDEQLLLAEKEKVFDDHFNKLLESRAKMVEKALSMMDKMYQDEAKLLKSASEAQLQALELRKNQEISHAETSILNQTNFLMEKYRLEDDYYKQSQIMIEEATVKEIAAWNRVYAAKKEFLEKQTQIIGENKKYMMAALEQENAEKLAAIYKDDLVKYKGLIDGKIAEGQRYKSEYIAALKEIENAERSLTKTKEDLEGQRREALRLTMDSEQQRADKEREIQSIIGAGWKQLNETDKSLTLDAAKVKVASAQDYFNKASGMIGNLTVMKKDAEGKEVMDAEATKNARVGFIGQLINAQEAATKKLVDIAQSTADASRSKMSGIEKTIDTLMAKYNDVAERLAKELTVAINIDSALAQLNRLLTAIDESNRGDKFAIVIRILGKASPVDTLTNTINEVMKTLASFQTQLVEKPPSYVVYFEGADGTEKKSLSLKITETQNSFRKLCDEVGKTDFKAVFALKGDAGEGAKMLSPLIDDMKKRFENLASAISAKSANFIVHFMGSDGTGMTSLSTMIASVETRMNDLFNKINGMRAVFTVVTKYVKEGQEPVFGGFTGFGIPYQFGEGGDVPGTGDTDSVPANLTPGEFVVRKGVVQMLGEGFFHFINNLKTFSVPNFKAPTQNFAQGGIVRQLSEVFTLNLQVGNEAVPLKVVGNPQTTRQQIKRLETELARMRLSHG
jgi:TP901 family phage tail tape measure protein